MSNLKHVTTLSIIVTPQINRTSTTPPPAKKQKMSLAQTYMLAHLARKQLSKEAARSDHDLRRLVGHANMLDSLMLDLAHAEQEQESWFNQTVRNASSPSEESKHIQWVDTIPEEALEDDEEEEEEEEGQLGESDNESESDDEGYETAQSMAVRKVTQIPITTVEEVEDEDDEMEEDDDYEADLALTRTSSAHPPELMQEDSDSESDDDAMPPSPQQTDITFETFSEKERQAIATSSFYPSDDTSTQAPPHDPVMDQDFYLPPRETAIATY
ncbi:MAG: hypothetical protein Q9163_004864 [Psora crenata]